MSVPISGDPTISGVVLAEQASTPSSPVAGKRKLFVTGAGVLRLVDSTGTAADAAAGAVHAIESGTHTTAGGTDGYALKQTGATTFAWEADYAALAFTIGDGVNAIVAASEPDQWVEVPFAGVIVSNRLTADASGSAVLDVWKDTYGNYPPTVADTITASAKPTLSAAAKSENTTLTGWTTTVAAGDWIRVHLESATTVKRLVFSLRLRKT